MSIPVTIQSTISQFWVRVPTSGLSNLSFGFPNPGARPLSYNFDLTISVKGEYALQAIFDLASQRPGEPVRIAEIARRQQIPQKFLELILASLKQGGFVESRRGAEGGYLLARPAENLSVGEVLRFVEGPAPHKGRGRRPGKRRSRRCGTRWTVPFPE